MESMPHQLYNALDQVVGAIFAPCVVHQLSYWSHATPLSTGLMQEGISPVASPFVVGFSQKVNLAEGAADCMTLFTWQKAALKVASLPWAAQTYQFPFISQPSRMCAFGKPWDADDWATWAKKASSLPAETSARV